MAKVKANPYPFDDWFIDGLTVVLTQGREFKVEPYVMIGQLRRAAMKRGIKVRLSGRGKLVVVTKGG